VEQLCLQSIPEDMAERSRTQPSLDGLEPVWTYHIVQRDSLEALPLAKEALKAIGSASQAKASTATWEHSTAAHLVRLRMLRASRPSPALARRVATHIRKFNAVLKTWNAMLLPTGSHPLLAPADTTAWTDERDPLHQLSGDVFQRQVHGHVNAAGLSLGLPFANDHEFARLHAAVRLLLPIIPALSASSPLLEGDRTGFLDARLEAMLHTHEDRPDLMGSVVPEAVFSQEDHDRIVLAPIAQALAEYGGEQNTDAEAANARAAVAFFDRGILELRVLEPQENPAVDLAVVEFITVALKALMNGRWVSTYLQRAWPETDLLAIYLQVIKDAGATLIANRDYLIMFGLLKQEQLSARRLWQHLFVELYGELSEDTRTHVGNILEKGCLASRILEQVGREPSEEKIRRCYAELATCLAEGRSFG